MSDFGSSQEEEALRATIISHARAVYGPKYPAGSVFDVITGTEGVEWLSVIIVYPQTTPYSAGSVISGECNMIIDLVGKAYSMPLSYNMLLSQLRHQVCKTIKEKCKKGGINIG